MIIAEQRMKLIDEAVQTPGPRMRHSVRNETMAEQEGCLVRCFSQRTRQLDLVGLVGLVLVFLQVLMNTMKHSIYYHM